MKNKLMVVGSTALVIGTVGTANLVQFVYFATGWQCPVWFQWTLYGLVLAAMLAGAVILALPSFGVSIPVAAAWAAFSIGGIAS